MDGKRGPYLSSFLPGISAIFRIEVNDVTLKQEKALAALLTSSTHEEAAKKAGISSRTLRNYLADQEFARRYQQGGADLVDAATKQIQRSLAPAITALREIAEDAEAGRGARVQAARALLEYGIRLSEIGDIYQRLAELEALDMGGGE